MKINREILNKLYKELSKPYVSILIGPRQVGKSFLLSELKQMAEKIGLKTKLFNLEIPRDINAFIGTDENIIEMILQCGDVVFIDEFHYLKNATKIFKAIYDSNSKIKIYASGSSSIDIHRHLKESLAGRFRLTKIYPLYIKELSQLKKYNKLDYFKMGGMPGLIHEETFEDKVELLNNIVQTYLLKDIKSLIKEENIRAFNHLLFFIAQNQGSIISIANLAREIRLSEPAVSHHLDLLAQTFVAFPLSSYSKNLANELKKAKKYYQFDIGIRNCLLNDFSDIENREDRGIIIESFVFLSFIKQLKPNMDIKFWRTRQGDEVDFILLKNRIPYPIEVKYKLNSKNIPDGIKKFLVKYKNAPGGMVISKDLQGEMKFDNRTIKFIKWEHVENIEYLKN
ncbi:MAG: ATP-binding protein, partial [Spirochaetes bacterium]|nr:ATP-binding protein [Spirochaetota bacterium]